MISRLLGPLCAIGIAASTLPLFSQTDDSSSTFGIRGGVTFEHDLYDLDAASGTTYAARRPSSLVRLLLNPIVTLGAVEIPFDLMLTIPESATRGGAGTTLQEFMTNPANALGVSPSLGWATLSLGTHTPQLSELSGGDVALFGVGTRLAPGDFRVVASAGSIGQPGGFDRHALMGRLAYAPEGGEIGINVVRVRDDGGSFAGGALVLPAESFTAALDARAAITDGLVARGEVAASMFTRDMFADEIPDPPSELASLMRQRMSTRADIAATASIALERDSWGISLNGDYIGAGYRTLAYPWMESDRLDLAVAAHTSILDDALSVAGTLGWRQNDLAQTEGAMTSQLLGSFSADARVGDLVAINAQYSNYGMRNRFENDTLRVESIAQSASITPTISATTGVLAHTVSASAAINDYTDHNPITGAEASNRTRSIAGSYALSYLEIPLDLTLSASTIANELSVGTLSMTSGSVGVGADLLDRALRLGVTATISRAAMGDDAPDEGTGLELRASWRATRSLAFDASAWIGYYAYDGVRTGESFVERFLRTSLHWQW